MNIVKMRISANVFVWAFAVFSICVPIRAALAAEAALPIAAASYPPKGFVYVRDAVPEAALDIRYFGLDNFLGARVDGYDAAEALLSVEAAAALKAVAKDLRGNGYGLKIFDAYRPEWAVRHFARWAKDLVDTRNKASFYPGVDKAKLFELGYIAGKSGHSRGSAVDLTLIDLESGQDIDMGSRFDFFGGISHHGSRLITARQAANRAILREAMEARGFKRLETEWWHYILKNEPYPETYFDFPVAAAPALDPAASRRLDAHAGGADRLLIVSRKPGAAHDRAVVRAYVKSGEIWTLRFSTDAWLGKNGFRQDKREGDGTTPVGVFAFGRAFGIADDPGSATPYTKVDSADVWVDDPASKYYNQWARTGYPDADWRSAERLAKYGQAYKYAIAVNYNVSPIVPGKGSAIFLHTAVGKPTAGCVAVQEAAMIFFLGFIKENSKIVLAPSLENSRRD
ncbi:MAG: L,D-transpeptidase family protein [Azoarcus sp.]|jgi:D-alanyl-D-alanine dipeptidase/L,D-peptidoglycan transpeptidase YkuD (ErfK/YbiS/YcfS/YnhG family)|nr:L,D-transpeptidase family protein [Azoarcus sp.]